MRGERKQIHRQRANVERQLAHRLRGVDVEGDASVATDFADGADILDDPDLVVRVHDGNEDGVGTQRRPKRIRLNAAGGVGRHIGNDEPFALELLARIEHGLVLDLRCDHVARLAGTGARYAQHREIVRLRGAGGEDHIAG